METSAATATKTKVVKLRTEAKLPFRLRGRCRVTDKLKEFYPSRVMPGGSILRSYRLFEFFAFFIGSNIFSIKTPQNHTCCFCYQPKTCITNASKMCQIFGLHPYKLKLATLHATIGRVARHPLRKKAKPRMYKKSQTG